MSREIKFRAWDIHMKKYYKVENICFNGNPMVTVEYNLVKKVPMIDLYIEQFTGLHDKNGKEIYEGDIVEGNGRRQTVEFDSDVDCDGMELSCSGWFISGMLGNECEVIGNIHLGVTNEEVPT